MPMMCTTHNAPRTCFAERVRFGVEVEVVVAVAVAAPLLVVLDVGLLLLGVDAEPEAVAVVLEGLCWVVDTAANEGARDN
jgi:hypothetical protein